jgi:4-hydroxy-3-methylbut-2-enyl diphosphate reductase
MLEKIYLIKPRGFCAGVKRAVLTVEKALEKFGTPIYTRHQIVHNNYVVKSLEEKGVIFVEEISEIPKNNVVVFSAHGIPPKVMQEAKEKNLIVIDATCPLVKKVHLEAVRYQKNDYKIILIGHKGHQEVLGTMGYAEMVLVENITDVENLKIPSSTEKIVYLTQTTLSLDGTQEIIEALKKKYPHINAAPKKDICYSSQNRQTAVKELVKYVDCVLVVGSTNSSNSNRLVETAKRQGIDSYLIHNLESIKNSHFSNYKNVGISSGASVPDELVDKLID